jgi:FAD/FMN-containing dehydrogenase
VGAGGKTVKNVSGYDISKLMVGSLGSLGVICDLTCRLLPLPERVETVFVRFSSLEKAMDMAGRILQTKLIPAALDIMNGAAFLGTGSRDLDIHEGDFIVAVALESFTESLERMQKELLAMAGILGAAETAVAPEDDHRRFWLGVSELGNPKNGENGVSAKLTCSLSKWKEITTLTATTLSHIPSRIQVHAGNGICLLHMEPPDASSASEALSPLLKGALEAGGNLSVLNAPAPWKAELPIWGQPGRNMEVMRHLKSELDPAGILNTGRYVGGI